MQFKRRRKTFNKCQKILVYLITITESLLMFLLFFGKSPIGKKLVGVPFEGCFVEQNGELQDIVFSERKPNLGRNIFFLETSYTTPRSTELLNVTLNPRQACAIESAARMNPNTDVFVLFVGDHLWMNVTDHKILEIITSYPNVHLRRLDYCTFSYGTPFFRWLTEEYKTYYRTEDMSDVLRLLTLWKYGGTYLDLDVVVVKNMETLPSNFVGAESENLIGNAVIDFAPHGFGHELVNMCLRDFQNKFNGCDLTLNGLLLRMLRKICQTRLTTNMTPERCNQFTVYPKKYFYTVESYNWKYFFEPNHYEKVMNRTKDSILVHLWNSASKDNQVEVHSRVAYAKLAEMYCPMAYASSGRNF